MKPIRTKLVGVTHRNGDGLSRQEAIDRWCRDGQQLVLAREHNNQHDSNAVAALISTRTKRGQVQIGYLSAQLAAQLAPVMDAGTPLSCRILQVTGDGRSMIYGVNIEITQRQDSPRRKGMSIWRLTQLIAGFCLIVSILVCMGAMAIPDHQAATAWGTSALAVMLVAAAVWGPLKFLRWICQG